MHFPYKNERFVTSRAPGRKPQTKVYFSGHSRILGPQYGNFFMSAL